MSTQDPQASARAHFMRGLDHLQAGRMAEAEPEFAAALALAPGRPSVLLNLAATRLALGRPAEALRLLDELLAQQADDVEALGHRGLALVRLQRPAEAGPMFERITQLDPQRADAWYHLGQVLQQLGASDRALAAFDRCVALRPAHGPSWSQRAQVLRELGRDAEAAEGFERALALGDDAALNGYFLAALRGDRVPPAPPRDYVQRLFDDYAPDFDRHLVDTLGYCAPEVLARLLVSVGARGAVLDLGCGTGLCAPLLRPLADPLHGLDLSRPMLDAAATRGLYDALWQGDVAEHLAATEQRYDVLVAADVFIYVGALEAVFAGARRVLRPGGWFAFSVEPAASGLQLQASLRYAHGDDHVQALAAAQGFEVRQVERGALRRDERHTVAGRYWLLQAP